MNVSEGTVKGKGEQELSIHKTEDQYFTLDVNEEPAMGEA